MAATKDDIRRWLLEARRRHATHVVVVCDTFDYDDYPVYVMPGESVRKAAADHSGNMQQVMEVYALHLPIEAQLAEFRAFHYEGAPAKARPPRVPRGMVLDVCGRLVPARPKRSARAA